MYIHNSSKPCPTCNHENHTFLVKCDICMNGDLEYRGVFHVKVGNEIYMEICNDCITKVQELLQPLIHPEAAEFYKNMRQKALK